MGVSRRGVFKWREVLGPAFPPNQKGLFVTSFSDAGPASVDHPEQVQLLSPWHYGNSNQARVQRYSNPGRKGFIVSMYVIPYYTHIISQNKLGLISA